MSQMWHNLCCRDPCIENCEDCVGYDKIRVTWSGSITYEANCCEDPVNYPDYPCYPHIGCTLWSLPATTIGPIDFVLTRKVDPSAGPCYWEGQECFTLVTERCVICDCPNEENPQPDPVTIYVCVRLRLFCIGGLNGVYNASLEFAIRYDEPCCPDPWATDWSVLFLEDRPPGCSTRCPDFECNEEWDPYQYSGNPGTAYGGGAANCNRYAGPTNPIPLATIDYGTLVWTSAC
jgi:hypothetical protein